MKVLERFNFENARAYALRVILHNIINLELEPGKAISENEISAELNLSRTPVREALIELSRNGMVDIYPQRGSYISKIDYNIIEESRFVRVVLESAVLKLACENITEEYLAKLCHNVKKQKENVENPDYSVFLELDNEFHKLLFESVEKMWTYNIVRSQMMHFDRLRTLSVKTVIKNNRVLEDHENILYAIERHDFELADMLMKKHLSRHIIQKDNLQKTYPNYFV